MTTIQLPGPEAAAPQHDGGPASSSARVAAPGAHSGAARGLGRRPLLLAALAAGLAPGAQAAASGPWGVVLLHGKNPGSAQAPSLDALHTLLQSRAALVRRPDMPWSRTRYIDKDFGEALQEIHEHARALRAQGARKLVLVGHSMGCPAALAYAAHYQDADALALLAPGHALRPILAAPQFAALRESVEQARALVAQGQGEQGGVAFNDVNQGRRLTLRTTPRRYLSYFDPDGEAEMQNTAGRIGTGTAVMWVIGRSDPMFRFGRGYAFDKLAPNPKHQYLEVEADHLSTPTVAAPAVLQWLEGALD
ncbi:MAG: alpha/beta fold hydrolase [Rhodoferax sp.]